MVLYYSLGEMAHMFLFTNGIYHEFISVQTEVSIIYIFINTTMIYEYFSSKYVVALVYFIRSYGVYQLFEGFGDSPL